jgi:hypothetical protein
VAPQWRGRRRHDWSLFLPRTLNPGPPGNAVSVAVGWRWGGSLKGRQLTTPVVDHDDRACQLVQAGGGVHGRSAARVLAANKRCGRPDPSGGVGPLFWHQARCALHAPSRSKLTASGCPERRHRTTPPSSGRRGPEQALRGRRRRCRRTDGRMSPLPLRRSPRLDDVGALGAERSRLRHGRLRRQAAARYRAAGPRWGARGPYLARRRYRSRSAILHAGARNMLAARFAITALARSLPAEADAVASEFAPEPEGGRGKGGCLAALSGSSWRAVRPELLRGVRGRFAVDG